MALWYVGMSKHVPHNFHIKGDYHHSKPIVSWVFHAHQAQVQAAEAAARFAQEWGRVENEKERHQGAMEVCCVSVYWARKGTKDVKMEMLQWCQEQAQAVAEAQQRAVVQAFA